MKRKEETRPRNIEKHNLTLGGLKAKLTGEKNKENSFTGAEASSRLWK